MVKARLKPRTSKPELKTINYKLMKITADDFFNGQVILVNKPKTWTSFDVVNKMRSDLRHTHQIPFAKIGHAGTLDPLATGLLIVCIGRKTKTIESYQGLEKE